MLYKVYAGEVTGSTRVDLEIGYTLAGGLAQFSRGGLVEDVADRLTAAFVANLEARMSGRQLAAPAAELDAGSLLYAALTARLRRILAALFRRA